jgi:hypothetical protein
MSVFKYDFNAILKCFFSHYTFEIIWQIIEGARGSLVVKALGYKPEGHGFESQWGEILNLRNPSGRTRPWGLLTSNKNEYWKH